MSAQPHGAGVPSAGARRRMRKPGSLVMMMKITTPHRAMSVLLLAASCSADGARPSQFATVERDATTGTWWFQRGSERFLSQGVSNLNDGGLDDGVGDVLGTECRKQQNTSLCGDTNNWDMDLNYSPYHNVTQALFNGSAEAWAEDSAAMLESWHFNTISGYSSTHAERAMGARGLFYNRLLMFATRFAMPGGTPLQQSTAGGCFGVDIFSPTFAADADAYARANVLPRANDTALLGWHFEKEVSWSKMDLRYWLNPFVFAQGSPARAAATSFVQARYDNDIKRLNDAWGCHASSFSELPNCVSPNSYRWQCQRSGDAGWPPGVDAAHVVADSEAFILIFAKKYFDVVTQAIRRYDSNHLLFGMRGGCFGSHSMLSLFSSYIDVYDGDRPPPLPPQPTPPCIQA